MSTYIYIPEELFEKKLSDYPIHPTILELLTFHEFIYLGNFHLNTLENIMSVTQRNFPWFRQGLINIVHRIGGHVTDVEPEKAHNSAEESLDAHSTIYTENSIDSDHIEIPVWAKDWPLDTLPMTARTRSALVDKPVNAKTLADIQGCRYETLGLIPNFGKKSQEDLKALLVRIKSGEFGTHALAEGFPEVATVEGAVSFIETYIKAAFSRLSAQDQSILEMRYGFGSHSTPHQLTAIADELGYSKERIRQIVENSIIPELQTGAGPKLGLALTTIRSHYVDNHLPFESDKKTTALVHFLDRSIPILIELPEKHNRGGIYNPTSVKDVLSRYFVGCGVNIEVRAAEACAYACQAVPKLTTFRFYHDVERLGFSFYKKAEQLCISKDKWTALEMVQIALEASSQPVHVDHLIEWAKAQPSFKNGEYRAENLLGLTGKPNETGVFLLDSKTIGLARHIRLAPALWDFVRIAFARFLKKNGAESTVYDFLKQERYTWFDQTNAFELSAILQLDPDKRFEKLSGKMKYTLANAA